MLIFNVIPKMLWLQEMAALRKTDRREKLLCKMTEMANRHPTQKKKECSRSISRQLSDHLRHTPDNLRHTPDNDSDLDIRAFQNNEDMEDGTTGQGSYSGLS